jgi:Cytochrome C'
MLKSHFAAGVAVLAVGSALLTGCTAADKSTAPATPSASTAAAPRADPSWTGLTNPVELIAARNEIMAAAEELMKPIDALQIDPKGDVDVLRGNAKLLAAVLHAVPHLFPPTTNLFVLGDQYPKTLALPSVWVNFAHFTTQAESAILAAETMSKAETPEALRIAGAQLRANCDACHAGYLRKYVRQLPQASDYEFDFDAALKDLSAP